MREIEVLVRLEEPTDSAKSKIESLATFIRTIRLKDTYFYDPLRKDLSPDTEGHLTAAFRVRDRFDESARVTYKKDHFGADGAWLYSDEFETSVGDAKTLFEIVEHLGLKQLVVVETEKSYYESSGFEIVVEDVLGLGAFLEVELRDGDDGGDVEVLKGRVQKYLDSLGVLYSRASDAGKPEMLLAQARR